MESYNSIKNQEIKGKFVGQHVFAGVTAIVEFVLAQSYENRDAPLSYDDFPYNGYYEDRDGNIYTEDEKSEQIDQWEAELDEVEIDLLDEDNADDELEIRKKDLQDKIEDLDGASETYVEIYEWWIVSDYFAEQLEQHKHIVISDGANHYWGRRTTGQAILLDHIVSVICDQMEILEGQRYAWL